MSRSVPVPEEPLEFLGYRFGRNHCADHRSAYIGTRPGRSGAVSVPQDHQVDSHGRCH